MPAARPDLASTLAAVRTIYSAADATPAERDCRHRTDCCRFRLTGRTPQLTAGEAALAAHAWKASGRKSLPEPAIPGECPFLTLSGKCGIYASRPFGCRTHFCRPAGGPLPRRDLIDLIRQLEAIDRSLGGDGPRPLEPAVAMAWKSR